MDVQESNIFFRDLCRLCLVNIGTTFIDEDLQQNVFICTGVEVSLAENLPSKICVTCYEILNKAIQFRETVTQNDSLLKSLYDNTNKEDIIEYSIVINEENEDSNEDIENNYCEEETLHNSNTNDNYTYSCIVNLTSSTPLGTLTIRKDLFPNSVQETQRENIDYGNKDESETSKNQDKSEETHKDKIKCKKKVKAKPECEEKDVIVHKCQKCGKTFDTRRKLYDHTRRHVKTKECDECGKMFYSKSDLEKHIRIHTGVRPYQCNLCKKHFTQKSTLNSHIYAIH